MERETERAEKHYQVGSLKAHKVEAKRLTLVFSLDLHTTV